ncbi:hypothetical protein V8G54_022669 [Vigna mungo]|uniref:Integrase catalytic domain-containing protein n=1 Tax=Vigna mungo TaxID=3915 RepID=A0AAQ3RQU9_VIGMU
MSAKNKIQFIDANSYHAWTRCNNIVVSWLVHSVSPDIRRSILWMDNAQAIWDDLKSRFFQGDLLCISELQNEAASLNFALSQPALVSEIRCSCNLTSAISQRKHEDQILQFLRGLNEQYENIQSHVLLMDHMSPILKIFSYVVQQERKVISNNFLNGLEIKHVVVVGIVTCSYCGKNGHNESVCFRKHGFPANKNITGKKICSHYGKTGHIIEVCYKKHGFPLDHKFHNGKSLMSTSQNTRSDGITDVIDQEVRLTQQHHQALMALLKSPSVTGASSTNQISSIIFDPIDTSKSIFTLISHEGKGIISWILDSGATDHDMTTNNKIGSVEINGGLYIFCGSINIPQRFIHSVDKHITDKFDSKNIWHNRLGHLSNNRLEILRQKYGYIDSRIENCNACHTTKYRRLPFSSSITHTSHAFDLIHIDISRPCSNPSLHSHRYFLTIVDDHTRYIWVHLMKHKSETRQHIVHFITYVKNHFNINIKTIRSDNSREFSMNDYFNTEGIIHQTSCIETPQQSIVERKHQHLLNVTRALLFHSKISTQLWTYALNYVTLLINIMPTPFLNNSSPYERLYKNAFDISRLRVFGCLCYVSTLHANRKKLDPRAKSNIFLGLHPTTKGYITYDLDNHDIKVSRNVVFLEIEFPIITSHPVQDQTTSMPLSTNSFMYNDDNTHT